MKWPALILVNGPSSAGKSTLCRALQAEIESPYLVTGFDDFVFMSAPRYYRGADTSHQHETDSLTALGVEMVITSEPGAPVCVEARFGPVFRNILDAMAPAVRASGRAAIVCSDARGDWSTSCTHSATTMSWSTPARRHHKPV